MKKEQKKWSEMTSKEKKDVLIGCAIMIIVFLLIVFGISQCVSDSDEPKEAIYNSEWDGSVFEVKKYLLKNLNDPDSYEPVEWSPVYRNPNTLLYYVRHKYRAKNGFGAKVLQEEIFMLDSLGNILSIEEVKR